MGSLPTDAPSHAPPAFPMRWTGMSRRLMRASLRASSVWLDLVAGAGVAVPGLQNCLAYGQSRCQCAARYLPTKVRCTAQTKPRTTSQLFFSAICLLSDTIELLNGSLSMPTEHCGRVSVWRWLPSFIRSAPRSHNDQVFLMYYSPAHLHHQLRRPYLIWTRLMDDLLSLQTDSAYISSMMLTIARR
jgi:hypothetical protein